MTGSPLVVYLDTQDYIRLFNEESDGPAHKILNEVLSFRDRGDINIGYSWVTIVEFITRPTEKFRRERVRRGQLIKDICGPNAFPDLVGLSKGAQFPNNGQWISGRDGQLVKAKWFRRQMEKQFIEAMSEQTGLNRAERRRLKTRSGMRQIIRDHGASWGTKREHYGGVPVSDELIESGVLRRFMSGQCSDAEFEVSINRWFSDPAEFSRIFYDYAGKENLLDLFFGESLKSMEDAFNRMQSALREFDNWEIRNREVRAKMLKMGFDRKSASKFTKKLKKPALDSSKLVRKVEQYIGEGNANHIGHYLQKSFRKDYSFKRSDFLDIMQMCYVPQCDLFRCDKAMASLYRDYEPFSGKLVAKFAELPERIETRLLERE